MLCFVLKLETPEDPCCVQSAERFAKISFVFWSETQSKWSCLHTISHVAGSPSATSESYRAAKWDALEIVLNILTCLVFDRSCLKHRTGLNRLTTTRVPCAWLIRTNLVNSTTARDAIRCFLPSRTKKMIYTGA